MRSQRCVGMLPGRASSKFSRVVERSETLESEQKENVSRQGIISEPLFFHSKKCLIINLTAYICEIKKGSIVHDAPRDLLLQLDKGLTYRNFHVANEIDAWSKSVEVVAGSRAHDELAVNRVHILLVGCRGVHHVVKA